MKKQWLGCVVVFGCLLTQAQAADLRFFGGAGVAFGGDTLASGTYTDGTSYEVNAGQGIVLSVGADYRVADKVTVQGSVGYQSGSTNAKNGDISFKRLPVELLVFYDISNQMRIGGGVRKANSAELTVSGAAAGSATPGTYDSSVGTVLEGQYFFSPAPAATAVRKAQWGLNLRYVSETYTPTNASASAKSGNHLGLGVVMYY